jgi:hypothetical protein
VPEHVGNDAPTEGVFNCQTLDFAGGGQNQHSIVVARGVDHRLAVVDCALKSTGLSNGTPSYKALQGSAASQYLNQKLRQSCRSMTLFTVRDYRKALGTVLPIRTWREHGQMIGASISKSRKVAYVRRKEQIAQLAVEEIAPLR